VVVLTDATLEEAKRIDAYCHSHGIRFIYAQTRGVFASVFTDFGPSFTVFDVDGGVLPVIWDPCTISSRFPWPVLCTLLVEVTPCTQL
jgi:hypothetical protein